MKHEHKQKFWHFELETGWQRKEMPAVESYDDLEPFLEKLGYLPKCDFALGDEFSFIEMYEHPIDDHYLFHVCLNNFNKIIFSFNTPSALHLLAELKKLVD